jgi:hypothetical protein
MYAHIGEPNNYFILAFFILHLHFRFLYGIRALELPRATSIQLLSATLVLTSNQVYFNLQKSSQ